MYITKATKSDYLAVCSLFEKYNKMEITKAHLNKKDIALKACDEDGSLIGFLWCGLMANDTIAYIDKFTVHPDFAHKKVGYLLAKEMLEQVRKRGIKEVFGIVYQDEWHDRSCMNALRWAFGAHSRPYTYVTAKVDTILKEIKSLEI